MPNPAYRARRIAPGAYNALVDALAVVYWNLQPFERFIRVHLRDHPELLAGLSFQGFKRQTASDLVGLLADNEDRYQGVTLGLMLEISGMDDFPNLKSQKDADALLAKAKAAVAELRKWTAQYGDLVEAREQLAKEAEEERVRTERYRSMANVLKELEQRFLAMHHKADHSERGRMFEACSTTSSPCSS
jgi:hypothetical protein